MSQILGIFFSSYNRSLDLHRSYYINISHHILSHPVTFSFLKLRVGTCLKGLNRLKYPVNFVSVPLTEVMCSFQKVLGGVYTGHFRFPPPIISGGGNAALFGSRLNYSPLGIVITLTTNYGVKQSQFIKPTSKPRASDPEESNEVFDRAIREWYCSIIVANHRLIIVIRFVAKNYTHS